MLKNIKNNIPKTISSSFYAFLYMFHLLYNNNKLLYINFKIIQDIISLVFCGYVWATGTHWHIAFS